MEEGSAYAAFSILDPQGKTDEKREMPAYIQDLNLETIFDYLSVTGGKSVLRYYRFLPETAEAEAYRRAVYSDVKKDRVCKALTGFTEGMAQVHDLFRKRDYAQDSMQKAVWLVREVDAWCSACRQLKEDLEQAELTSPGLLRFRDIIRQMTESGDFQDMYGQVHGILQEIRGLRLIITYEKDRIRVEVPEDGKENGTNPIQEGGLIRNPFAAGAELSEMEKECLEVLKKRKPAFFRAILEVAGRFESYENPVLARFEKEIRFYLSYCALQREMEEKGFAFAVPSVLEDRPMEGRGLYDLALACVHVRSGKPVVANDFCYRAGERFFVVTGMNQGGKTTFARSLGQLVYFARMGLDVPAREANVPFFQDLQTHFSVEESVETGRGKLKEELMRLAPMMEEERRGTFVVINELFTTAANYDARIMGGKVLEHFISLDCMGVYVTHLKELASVHPKVVSLRAVQDENGEATYQIRRGEAADSGSAENQVRKYGLTYQQLKERL